MSGTKPSSGNATGGNATGGNATGGSATGGNATGGSTGSTGGQTGSTGGQTSQGSASQGGQSGQVNILGFVRVDQVELALSRDRVRFVNELRRLMSQFTVTVHNWRAGSDSDMARFLDRWGLSVQFVNQGPGLNDPFIQNSQLDLVEKMDVVVQHYRHHGGLNEHFARVYSVARIAEYVGLRD